MEWQMNTQHARDSEIMGSPLSLQIALHYGSHPLGSWPGYDFRGLHFPSQAKIIKQFIEDGYLAETERPIAGPLGSKYEATTKLRDLVHDVLEGYQHILRGSETV